MCSCGARMDGTNAKTASSRTTTDGNSTHDTFCDPTVSGPFVHRSQFSTPTEGHRHRDCPRTWIRRADRPRPLDVYRIAGARLTGATSNAGRRHGDTADAHSHRSCRLDGNTRATESRH